MTTAGRTETSEGLDRKPSLHYSSRIRFMQNLLPALTQAAASDNLSRVVSVFSPSTKGPLISNDLDLKHHYSLSNAAAHATTMNSLALIHLATAHPSISFIQSYGG